MRSGHCWGSAGRRWLRRMTGCTPVHGNIQNATAKAWRASSELGYRQNRHQIWCSWVSTGQAWNEGYPFSGTGNLYNFTKGLISIAVQSNIVIIYDNDAEGVSSFNRTT